MLNAIVILPDHLHAIWQLPIDDDNYSLRWQKIKSYFTFLLKKNGVSFYQDQRGEHHLWQRRFWEHTIKNECDFENHLNYIHYNPVKHGYVKQIQDWPFSSIHRHAEREKLLLYQDRSTINNTSYGE